MLNPSKLPVRPSSRRSITKALAAAALLFSGGLARADVITSLTLESPGAIQVGGTVTVDLGITFTPVPGSVLGTEFIDNQTAAGVPSCSADRNPCTELQFTMTPSTLTSVFAELIAGNAPGSPNFFSESSTGHFQFVLPYPNAGTWQITTAGLAQEQTSELECTTAWNAGVPVSSASCSTVLTVPFGSAFDPGGSPSLLITVNPPGLNTPEPASVALVAASLAVLSLKRRTVEK